MNFMKRLIKANPFTKHTSRYGLKDSYQLLEDYEASLLSGQYPDPKDYLTKCPESEKEAMVFAFNLATLSMGPNSAKDKEWNEWVRSGGVEAAKKRCIEKLKARFLNDDH